MQDLRVQNATALAQAIACVSSLVHIAHGQARPLAPDMGFVLMGRVSTRQQLLEVVSRLASLRAVVHPSLSCPGQKSNLKTTTLGMVGALDSAEELVSASIYDIDAD
eukprot:6456532-Amphidinium_carterae.1